MFRPALAALIFIPLAFSQNLPRFRWIKEVDHSGGDTIAGLGVDAQGNTYVAGSTGSVSFPTQAAVQNHLASDGLYRIDGPGTAYTALPVATATFVVSDPRNDSILYVISAGKLLRSPDGGASFQTLSFPSPYPEVIAIDPSNPQDLYVGTFDQGTLKSTDGGANWNPANGTLQGSPGQFTTQGLWIDPTQPNVIFANTIGDFVRSADGGASWQVLAAKVDVISLVFDSTNPGALYAESVDSVLYRSTDHGQTFTTFDTPSRFQAITADPARPGRLIALTVGAAEESMDGGATWTNKLVFSSFIQANLLAADWADGYLYLVDGNNVVLRATADLSSFAPLGPPALGPVRSLAVVSGHVFAAVLGSGDVYVTKLDPSGSIVYSTYFGGSADDVAQGMTVDAAGNVYVTGTTRSSDFPVTKGAFASSGSSFLFRLNPDGTLGYSTYFTSVSATPTAIAVDSAGSVYIAGTARDGLPTTPGALQPKCDCPFIPTGFLTIFQSSGFAAKFSPDGSSLLYATYVAGTNSVENVVQAIALAGDGSLYLSSNNGVFQLNATGSALLATAPSTVNAKTMAVAPDGSVYLAGSPNAVHFQPTPGAFDSGAGYPQNLPGQIVLRPNFAIEKLDEHLAGIRAATYFGGPYSVVNVLSVGRSGDVYVGGYTGPTGLPTRTPMQGGFSTTAGFLSKLSADLTTLEFSSYFGDLEHFGVKGIAEGPAGDVLLGGATGQADAYSVGPANIWVNDLTLPPPPALRIDSVVNAASLADGPISAGETIVVRGSGFGSDAKLSIGGAAVTPLSVSANAITAVVPQNLPDVAAEVAVTSGGSGSNQVLLPTALTSPGIFSQDLSGGGQGYILNQDSSLNSPSNPAKAGQWITIYATGVGPVSFTEGYAVTQFPVNVFLDNFYCSGAYAVMGPVQGFPGSVYRITVFVPNFTMPPLVGATIQINGVTSQPGLAISVSK